jgi:hypothetical protein
MMMAAIALLTMRMLLPRPLQLATDHDNPGDPALEAAMRLRSKDLGIAPGSRLDRVMQGWNIDRAIGRERGQELER